MKETNRMSRMITGSILGILGLIFAFFSITVDMWLFVYAIPTFVIGAVIFFNKNEDTIEQIKK